MTLSYQSHYLEGDGHRLHLCHISHNENAAGPAVLMVHGSIENGRIFYNHKGRGLGCFLARQGMQVYVLDLRGRGLSTPKIARGHLHGQLESICEDIPRAMAFVAARRGRFCTVAHSWGGVLLMACLIRQPHWIDRVERQVFFGTKRTIRVHNPERWLKLDLIWRNLAPLVARAKGYLPARQMGIGADNETRKMLRDTNLWVRSSHWHDPDDGFDYQKAAMGLGLPPTWFVTGLADYALGHYRDMRDFMQELGVSDHPHSLLSRKSGCLHDYDHINILTHPDCEKDHFPRVSQWLREGSGS
ncbi:alpha/beta fold hydrolase [Bowmanella dokdonensis]|uniref:Alpha/beta fold hydrolase n=1 Tax=Bowmanella dokdonensis TaxID=751969 RepID=A0A939IT69_9ALTE|nr:alpha/beta fold hydrolase [Bowmanella dokdonensis]MBN7827477.1 alpha/beta fold hydrolase [Bowmanella dokdonensis]